jgi:hypothetical protein
MFFHPMTKRPLSDTFVHLIAVYFTDLEGKITVSIVKNITRKTVIFALYLSF